MPLKQTAIPDSVLRTTLPSHSIRLRAPVSFLIFLFGTVISILNRVPSENFSVVSINAPAEDMSLVWNLKICFLFDFFVSILARSESGNLSNFRRSFMANTLSLTIAVV